MKTINLKKVFAATALLLTFGYASAFTPEIRVTGDKKIVLKLSNLSESTQLVIKDKNGYNFYSETINKNGVYSKVFDLTTLPDGNYKVELDGEIKIVTFPISIINNKIKTSDLIKTEIFKPIIHESGSKVYVSKKNPNNTPLHITILNSDNALVYEETLNGDAKLYRVYDFLKSGDYQISIISDEKTYHQTVKIQK